MKLPIYLDNHATTPIDPRVLEAMMPYYTDHFGNAASKTHSFGVNAQKAVEDARQTIADFIGASPQEIVFTSGTTESNNIAIKGAGEVYGDKGKHIITQATEHKAVLDSCKYMETKGFKVTYLPVDETGRISLKDLEAAITDETILISIMYANNEIGTIQPIKEIGEIAKDHNILFHCDAAQAAGKFPIDVNELGIDILCISAHKMYGPKGVGALYVRSRGPRVRLEPVVHGGGHEKGLRSGTLNVPLIVAQAKVCEIAVTDMEKDRLHISALRDKLQAGLLENIEDAVINGNTEHRLAGNLNMSFPYVDGGDLLTAICEDIAVSSGSACTSASVEPSFVLRALGVEEQIALTSVRFGIGRFNTEEEISYTIDKVTDIVKALREASPLYKAVKEERV